MNFIFHLSNCCFRKLCKDQSNDSPEACKGSESKSSDQSNNSQDLDSKSSQNFLPTLLTFSLSVGTFFTLGLALLTIVLYTKEENISYLLPIMLSSISFQIFGFFFVFSSIVLALPIFFGILSNHLEIKNCRYIFPFFFGLPIYGVLKPFTDNKFTFFILLLSFIISVAFYFIGYNYKKNSYIFFSILIFILLYFILLYQAPEYSNNLFQLTNYGGLTIKVEGSGSDDTPIKGCLLFNSEKEIYVRLNTTCSKNSSNPTIVYKINKMNLNDLKSSKSVVRIPSKKIVSIE